LWDHEPLPHRLGDEERPVEVVANDRLPPARRELLGGRRKLTPRVVDEDGRCAELGAYRVHECVHLLDVADVARAREDADAARPEFAPGGVEPLLLAPADRHLRAELTERVRRREADSAAAARDDRDVPREEARFENARHGAQKLPWKITRSAWIGAS